MMRVTLSILIRQSRAGQRCRFCQLGLPLRFHAIIYERYTLMLYA